MDGPGKGLMKRKLVVTAKDDSGDKVHEFTHLQDTLWQDDQSPAAPQNNNNGASPTTESNDG